MRETPAGTPIATPPDLHPRMGREAQSGACFAKHRNRPRLKTRNAVWENEGPLSEPLTTNPL